MTRHRRPFAELYTLARRHSRRADEADDLLQSALLAALESGRTDLAAPETRRWLSGVIRNRAAFDARTAGRRRRRDTAWAEAAPSVSPTAGPSTGEDLLHGLSPALRTTGLLVMNGCTRAEIGWLLNLPDTALRQRISQLRKALKDCEAPGQPELFGALAFGQLRRSLLAATRRGGAFLASHDPDGHLFVVGRSHFAPPRQQAGV